jgi:hypothetical protein
MRITSTVGFLIALVLNVFASAAHGQWTVTYLHPAGAVNSYGTGVSGVDEVGYSVVGTNDHAARWTGSAASFADMNPAGAVSSAILGTDGVHQIGSFKPTPTIPPATTFPVSRATIWSGTAISAVNIHPGGGSIFEAQSVGAAIEGSLQTGSFSGHEGEGVAARWNGTAGSYINIHPVAYGRSAGLGTDGVSIVGSVSGGSSVTFFHAGLWKFAPDVFVDLNPAGASDSQANDVDGTIQVGRIQLGTGADLTFHAALWTGTAASFVDLNPPGSSISELFGADGGFQVGYASSGAGIWAGTPDSFVNLHSLLTPGVYSLSEARSVWTDGVMVKIVGSAFNSVLARNEAILWTMTVPEPSTAALLVIGCVVALVGQRR